MYISSNCRVGEGGMKKNNRPQQTPGDNLSAIKAYNIIRRAASFLKEEQSEKLISSLFEKKKNQQLTSKIIHSLNL